MAKAGEYEQKPLSVDDPLEVKLAGEIQKLLMPKSLPSCSWCGMAAKNRMADILGGDFYDFIELGSGRQVIFIGDVTGHGLHASVVMSLIYGFIHRATQEECDPHAVVGDLNAFLRTFARRTELLDHLFSATIFLGVIDPGSLKMHYVNAGHPVGLVLRKNELIRLPATSFPIGYFDQAEFRVESFTFESHDRLLLYTDGLADSCDAQGEMYGVGRLVDAFRRLEGNHVLFLERIFNEISKYQAGQPPFDDCTAIVIDFHSSALNRG